MEGLRPGIPWSPGRNLLWGGKMKLPVLIVLHQEASTPGRIGHVLRDMGYPLDIRRPVLGDPLPATMAGHAAAIIFGGPMSANDPDDYLKREIDFIAVPMTEKKPFFGVCLGAQLLSKQLGGVVAEHPDGWVEIGYAPLIPTGEGKRLGEWPAHVYQWHREGLTLPCGATLLATNDTYEVQAFEAGPAVYGIQFHPEVTRQTMHRWAVTGRHRFALRGAQPAHRHLEDQLIHDPPVADWLRRFLRHWLSE
jgi:GMP synthase (glutamine-hydrolysing)